MNAVDNSTGNTTVTNTVDCDENDMNSTFATINPVKYNEQPRPFVNLFPAVLSVDDALRKPVHTTTKLCRVYEDPTGPY